MNRIMTWPSCVGVRSNPYRRSMSQSSSTPSGSATEATAETTAMSIAEVAEATGLSKDTLRWYEREGLVPRVDRTPSGYLSYDDATVRILTLIVRLRRTGLSVADTRAFVDMVNEGAASHGRRAHLLHEHRESVLGRLAELQEDLAAINAKIGHYDELIAAGLDCNAEPITDAVVLAAQKESA